MDLKIDQPLQGVKVLVVEDDADSRELLCEILKLAGAQVSGAQSTTEALESFGEFYPHVLVTDIGLPCEDGYVLIGKLRALEKARGISPTPAIALTGYGKEEHRNRARSAGFQFHMVKPVEPEQLIRVIGEIARPTA